MPRLTILPPLVLTILPPFTAQLVYGHPAGDHQRERDETFGVVALASGGVRHEDPLATATIVNDD